MMSGTWRPIVLGALVILVVLGAGWAVQRVTGGASSPGGAAVGEPAKGGRRRAAGGGRPGVRSLGPPPRSGVA